MLSGCAVANAIDAEDTNVMMAGTPQVIGKQELYRVNLTAVLVEYGRGCIREDEMKTVLPEQRLVRAFAAFTTCAQPDMEVRRNAIQRHIMMAADRRCEIYKQTLSTVDSNTNFIFGSVSTITGVLGGLIEESSQALSAAAGISSGLNAEFSRSFFKDTAVPVIFAGMDMKRQQISTTIASRRASTMAEYPLAEAVSDAIRYNGACSAVEGMKHVQDTLARPVGLDEARRIIASASDGIQEARIAAEADPAARATLWRQLQVERQARDAAGGVSGSSDATSAVAQAQNQLRVALAEKARLRQQAQQLLGLKAPTPEETALLVSVQQALASNTRLDKAQEELKAASDTVSRTQACLVTLSGDAELADGGKASKLLAALGRTDGFGSGASAGEVAARKSARQTALQGLIVTTANAGAAELQILDKTCAAM
ncbi:MAG: hypothetical protein NVV74_22485 [Magnetospirillum sp.]|nr:hypothetical protein [Magnetospirillum sp.]